jgi:glycosyltransferase involved in cell wall biosynthesis
MPKISVIIPTYNREKLVGETIQSVLRQTFTDLEVIVVDDGSTDNTKAVVDSYTDPRIKYVYQENRGASAARNKGIKISKGDYIAFLDSDDLYLENALKKSFDALESHKQVGFSYGQAYMMMRGDVIRIRKNPFHNSSTVIDSVKQIRELLSDFFSSPITMSTLVVKRYYVEEIGGFDEDLWFWEDGHFFIRMAKRSPSFYIAEPLIFRRLHSAQLNIVTKPGKEKAFPLILAEVFEDPDISPQCMNLKDKVYSDFFIYGMAQSVYRFDGKRARRFLRKSIRFYPRVIFCREMLRILYLYLASLMPDLLWLKVRDFKRRFRYLPPF